MVPTEFTETTTYYYLLKAMAEIATELSYPADAEKYGNLATNVKNAFNKKFYNSQTGVYTSVSGGGGRQSEQAMPLYYGLVPDGDEEKVAAVLAQRVKNDSYKIKTGEIALKPVFMTLAQYGYNDVVWEMANQTDCPSYGYWVVQGYTTTPEYWDVGAFSQNHCMMDHIEEWFFTQLGGIQNTGMAFDKINISPYFPADLNSSDISTKCNYGTIRSAWQRTTDGYKFQFTVPQGTEANIVVPISNAQVLKEKGKEISAGTAGIISVAYEGNKATIVVEGGKYEFTAGEGDVIEDTSGIDDIKSKINSLNGKVYDLSGRLVSESSNRKLKSGIYIIDGLKRLVK
jgi:alpha-L-rhamnosidase